MVMRAMPMNLEWNFDNWSLIQIMVERKCDGHTSELTARGSLFFLKSGNFEA